MTNLIIGLGEIGSALQKVFCCDGYDKVQTTKEKYDILHICFPYSEDFRAQVQEYQSLHEPKYTVIHSTVPLGTCRYLCAISSPVRGLHPFLEEGIRTFPKFLGGEQASEVADVFRRKGIRVILCDKQETTEAMKLFDTQYYLECVRFVKRVKAYCTEHDLDFHAVYTLANQSYNESYTKLGQAEYCRPVLQPIMTPTGGHCLVPNEKLLNSTVIPALGTNDDKRDEL